MLGEQRLILMSINVRRQLFLQKLQRVIRCAWCGTRSCAPHRANERRLLAIAPQSQRLLRSPIAPEFATMFVHDDFRLLARGTELLRMKSTSAFTTEGCFVSLLAAQSACLRQRDSECSPHKGRHFSEGLRRGPQVFLPRASLGGWKFTMSDCMNTAQP